MLSAGGGIDATMGPDRCFVPTSHSQFMAGVKKKSNKPSMIRISKHSFCKYIPKRRKRKITCSI